MSMKKTLLILLSLFLLLSVKDKNSIENMFKELKALIIKLGEENFTFYEDGDVLYNYNKVKKGDFIMVFEKLKEIFGRVMPQCDPSTITMDSVLTTDLGVDSLNMMLLAITVEDEFKIRFSSDAKLETVKDIVDYVEANAK